MNENNNSENNQSIKSIIFTNNNKNSRIINNENNENNIEDIIFNNNNNQNLDVDNFFSEKKDVIIEENIAIQEKNLIYKDDNIYLKELENQLLSEYPITRQDSIYIQQKVLSESKKLIDIKNKGIQKFNLIKNYIDKKSKPDFTQAVMRITLLRNGKILREYDFLQRKLLTRGQALNRRVTGRSKSLLRQHLSGQRNITKPKKQSLLSKIKSFFKLR
jgi:hypothetical protein